MNLKVIAFWKLQKFAEFFVESYSPFYKKLY